VIHVVGLCSIVSAENRMVMRVSAFSFASF
jgi:hypothetical protein